MRSSPSTEYLFDLKVWNYLWVSICLCFSILSSERVVVAELGILFYLRVGRSVFLARLQIVFGYRAPIKDRRLRSLLVFLASVICPRLYWFSLVTKRACENTAYNIWTGCLRHRCVRVLPRLTWFYSAAAQMAWMTFSAWPRGPGPAPVRPTHRYPQHYYPRYRRIFDPQRSPC